MGEHGEPINASPLVIGCRLRAHSHIDTDAVRRWIL